MDPPVVILASGGSRYLTIDIEVDNAGNLVGGVPGNDLEIFGEVTISGTTYSGLLLSGEVTGPFITPGASVTTGHHIERRQGIGSR